ncbi:endo-1,4-beta-xylanase [Vineibacter terrae]|uniref:endo-1,4-beta-xylanase n=1 Tax=Vineibacter terrae TaxID=2586908 RepID=UPI0015B73D9C|nr:endo-1,4-beta-xylanase [Vineibacter terrae]
MGFRKSGLPSSLAAAAADTGRYCGTSAQIEQIDGQPDLRAAIVRECTWLTPEYALKWDAIEPKPGSHLFTPVDDLLRFSDAHGMKVRGHTLLWHRTVPSWAERILRESKDWGPIHRHFSTVLARYGQAIDQWDVINEPLEPGHHGDGLRRSVFLDVFGPDYIRRALEEARILAPTARLMVNEYGLEYDLPDERSRRHCLLKLVERLKAAGAPLDGLGIQGHLDLGKGKIDATAFGDFLAEIAALGLFIVITELDVREADRQAPVAARDRRVADEVRRYLDVALAQPAVRGVITWGMTDRHSWLSPSTADEGHATDTARTTRDRNRGLPFDAAMHRKPMHSAIRESLLAAPR